MNGVLSPNELFNGSLQSGADKQPRTVKKFLSSQGSAGSASAKVSKKRTRPTKRLPITVLSADTSNFKAMVQQFTGIPIGAPRQPFFSSSASMNIPPILKQYPVPETSLDVVPTLDTSAFLLSLRSQSAAGDPQHISEIPLTHGMLAAANIPPLKAHYIGETTDLDIFVHCHTQRTLPSATYHEFEIPREVLGYAFPMWDPNVRIKRRDAAYLGSATGLMGSVGGGSDFHGANANSNESMVTISMQNFSPCGLTGHL